MPPQSRRQRKYASELQKLQARNRTAAILGLITLAVAGWLIWYVWLADKPEIFVSVNRVMHTGAREIPFSDGSCDRVIEAFSRSDLGNPDVSKGIINAQNSNIGIPDGMDPGDSFVVYFQGHFVDAASRPSTSSKESSTAGQDVFWIAPENDNFERSVEGLFEQVQGSPAGLKIVLLDAGRYSWSPSFPGRPMNRSTTALAEYLKKNDLGLDDNFWVIVSHSDLEISHCSTPLGCSLFSFAVKESLKQFHESSEGNIDVLQWFQDLRKRVRSYSRDFNGRSTQHPVLLRAGVGLVDADSITEETLAADGDNRKIKFTWKQLESETETQQTATTYDWEIFKRPHDGSISDIDRFVDELVNQENLTALPYETTRALEDYLEKGNQSIVNAWDDEAKERFSVYFKTIDKNLLRPTDRKPSF